MPLAHWARDTDGSVFIAARDTDGSVFIAGQPRDTDQYLGPA